MTRDAVKVNVLKLQYFHYYLLLGNYLFGFNIANIMLLRIVITTLIIIYQKLTSSSLTS